MRSINETWRERRSNERRESTSKGRMEQRAVLPRRVWEWSLGCPVLINDPPEHLQKGGQGPVGVSGGGTGLPHLLLLLAEGMEIPFWLNFKKKKNQNQVQKPRKASHPLSRCVQELGVLLEGPCSLLGPGPLQFLYLLYILYILYSLFLSYWIAFLIIFYSIF